MPTKKKSASKIPAFSSLQLDIRYVYPAAGEPLYMRVSGPIDIEGTSQVEKAIRHMRRRFGKKCIWLDLSNVSELDRDGIDMLCRVDVSRAEKRLLAKGANLDVGEARFTVFCPPSSAQPELERSGISVSIDASKIDALSQRESFLL